MTSDRNAPARPVPPTPSGRSAHTPSGGGRAPARPSTLPAADRRGTPLPPAGPAGDAGQRSTGPVKPVKPVGPVGPLIVVTDRAQAAEAGHDLVAVVGAAVAGGARKVLLREKDLPAGERAALAEALAGVLAPAGGTLLVAGDARLARAVGAAGVHLSADQAHSDGRAGRLIEEGPGGRGWIVGRSCHSVAELRAAQAAGVDYVTFSPVWLTASKPGYGPALGLTGLAAGAAAVPGLPVYALGGIRPGRASRCQAAGAAGVAVMGEIMRAADPASVVQALLAELAQSGVPTSRRGPA